MGPYRVGIATAVGGGILSVPLLFHKPTVHWFNAKYVTTEVRSLRTWRPVWRFRYGRGTGWSPSSGRPRFCCSALSSQGMMLNTGWKPYGEKVRHWRRTRLQAFPQFDKEIVGDFAEYDLQGK